MSNAATTVYIVLVIVVQHDDILKMCSKRRRSIFEHLCLNDIRTFPLNDINKIFQY